MTSNFPPILPKPAMMYPSINNLMSFCSTCKIVRDGIFSKVEVKPEIGNFCEKH